MIRTTLFSLVALGFTNYAIAQSTLDAFQFPEFAETPSSKPAEKEDSDDLFISTDNNPLAHPQAAPSTAPTADPVPQQPAPVVPTPAPLVPTPAPAIQGIPNNQYSGTPQMQPGYAPFAGYMVSGPSAVTPLLAYMNHNQTACPNLWAGFAAQHAADMAHYCSKHGCHNCGCGGCGGGLYGQASFVPQGHRHKHGLHLNRYTQSAAPCDTCDGQ